jgi:hypothetical protein
MCVCVCFDTKEPTNLKWIYAMLLTFKCDGAELHRLRARYFLRESESINHACRFYIYIAAGPMMI